MLKKCNIGPAMLPFCIGVYYNLHIHLWRYVSTTSMFPSVGLFLKKQLPLHCVLRVRRLLLCKNMVVGWTSGFGDAHNVVLDLIGVSLTNLKVLKTHTKTKTNQNIHIQKGKKCKQIAEMPSVGGKPEWVEIGDGAIT